MTIKELMMPRYIVVKLYPNSPFILGQIVEKWEVTGWSFDSFPEIFRPLHWYKYRKEFELPQYVKFIWEKGEVQHIERVTSWLRFGEDEKKEICGFTYFADNFKEPYERRMALNDAVKFTTETGWFPATEEEYNKFHNKTQVK